ncbi:alpha/beta hydrolase family protein [Cupriavidus basilensis]|uniref:alpha/beta hydrolase family protein n=1 Tax=Cupriavidus basilensis TaxID=68895 RepID=UPI0009E1CB50|nr:alpha/beta fold hydrolase [Cupriavidus basilensis]
MKNAGIRHESIRFHAGDGYSLGGSYFPAQYDEKIPILICPATGVKQTFYYAFARWLCEQGYSVFVFDYRGIGASIAEPHIKFSKARIQDWGELDMPAALRWLLERTGANKAHLIGHSAGAQLVGLMPNHGAVCSLAAISASSGYIGNIGWPLRPVAAFLLLFYIPFSARLFGYVPAKWLGWGESLPVGVARQWSRWCRSPGYVENEFGAGVGHHYYQEFQAPITVVSACDDALATRRNIDDWLRLLPNARKSISVLRPADFGGEPIGHINMFRRSHSDMWPEMIKNFSGA